MTSTVEVGSAAPPRTASIRVRLRAPARRRNIEIVLLVLALAVGGIAMVLVQLGALGRVGGTVLALEALLAALVIGMHVALRVVAPDADPFVLPIAVLLNGLGLAEITRLDIAEGLNGWDAAGIRQIAWTAIALVLAIAVIIGTPMPATTRVVQIEPAPMPTLTALTPRSMSARVAPAVATFPAMRSTSGKASRTRPTMSSTPCECPCAVSITSTSTCAWTSAAARSMVSRLTPTAAPTRRRPNSSLQALGYFTSFWMSLTVMRPFSR